MKQRDLTNERLMKLFVSNCALANFAIFVARDAIANDTYVDLATTIDRVYDEAQGVADEATKDEWGIL